MTSEQRVPAALAGEQPDVTPFAPCYFDLYLNRTVRQIQAREYRKRLGGRGSYPVTHEEEIEIRVQSMREALRVFQELPDWLAAQQGFSREEAESLEVRELDGRIAYCDRKTGCPRQFLDRESPYTLPPWDDTNTPTLEQFEGQLKPESATDLLASGRYDLVRATVHAFPRFFTYGLVSSPYFLMACSLGFGGTMIALRENPGLCKELAARILRKAVGAVAAYCACGVNAIFCEECLAGNDCISPADYEEFALPFEDALLREIEKLGRPSIFYFTGDIANRVSQLKSLRPTAFHFEESKKGFSLEIKDIVRDFGDTCVFGNLDALTLASASDEWVEEQVRRQIEAGSKARGFILGIGSPFTPDTTPRRIDQVTALAHS